MLPLLPHLISLPGQIRVLIDRLGTPPDHLLSRIASSQTATVSMLLLVYLPILESFLELKSSTAPKSPCTEAVFPYCRPIRGGCAPDGAVMGSFHQRQGLHPAEQELFFRLEKW